MIYTEEEIRVLQGDIPYDEPPEKKSSGWVYVYLAVVVFGLGLLAWYVWGLVG